MRKLLSHVQWAIEDRFWELVHRWRDWRDRGQADIASIIVVVLLVLILLLFLRVRI